MSEMMLSQHLNTRGNVLAVGTSGTGKDRYLIEPNLLSGDGDLVVCEPRGELYKSTKEALEQKGYHVSVFSLDPNIPSDCFYEPFAYVKDEADIKPLIDVLTGDINDPFWRDGTASLLRALFAYVFRANREPTLSQVLALMQGAWEAEQITDPSAYINEKIEDLARAEGVSRMSYRHWQTFWNQEPIIRAHIWNSVCVTLQKTCAPAGMQTQSDMAVIDRWGKDDEKRALFLVTGMNSKSPLPAMMLTQLMHLRMEDKTLLSESDSGLRMILSEAGNAGYLPLLEKFLAVSRMYQTQIILGIPTIRQLGVVYGPVAPILIANTSASVLMGTNDMDTCEYFSQIAGERTKRCFPRFWELKRCRILPTTQLAGFPVEECFVWIGGEGAYLDGKLLIGDSIPLKKLGRKRKQ